jgi:hypothetical protein
VANPQLVGWYVFVSLTLFSLNRTRAKHNLEKKIQVVFMCTFL